MFKLKKLALATSLLLGANSAQALTPWTDGAPDLIIYTSGGAAQDRAISLAVENALAEPGSLDTFNDLQGTTVGGRWQAFYFTGKTGLPGSLAGKKIVFEKRSYGAAGYGVVPLFANEGAGLALEHLKIDGLAQDKWVAGSTAKTWNASITSANATTYLTKTLSDGGFLGVDPDILLKPNTENYPEQVNELTTGAPEANWPTTLNKVPDGFTIIPTGGLVYGVGVTADLYKVLQAAQKRAGTLPATAEIGHYEAKDLPNLNRNFVASVLSGKIPSWEQVKIVDKTDGNQAKSLNHPDILADAGVSAPYKNVDNKTPVGVGRRNKGAAIGAVAYAKFLNYPGTANANKPASNTPAGDEDIAAPIVKSPGGVRATNNLLIDWNNGTNTSSLNPKISEADAASPKVWGLAVNGGDGNPGTSAAGVGGNNWRYVKIDGYAPTIENVAAGAYPHWAEGVVLYPTNRASDAAWADKKALLKAFADDLGSPTVAAAVKTTLPYGVSGIFATTKDPRNFTAEIPFNVNNLVVPLTHYCDVTGSTHTAIVPVLDDKATIEIELK